MSKDSSTKRVIEILKDLNDAKVLNLSNLAFRYDTSERTIRRDFEIIKEIFGDIFVNLGGGNFAMVGKTLFGEILNSSEFSMLKEIVRISSKQGLEISQNLDKNIKEKIIQNESESPYLFKHKPFEEIFQKKEIFKFLERAIKYKKEIKFKYTNIDKISYFTIEPYKIALFENNFYLLGLEKKSKNKFHKILRISLISECEFSGNDFKRDLNYLDFVEFINSPWANYTPNFRENLIEVVVQIPKNQSKYFLLKKFYPTQEIIATNSDGSIDVSFKVINLAEIFTLIKQWIPTIKILKPRKLKKIVANMAEEFYKQTKEWD